MKKLFISCPMRNRSEEDIKRSMEHMHKCAEAIFGEELEVIPSYLGHEFDKNVKNHSVYYLGRSISKLSEADCFIGVLGNTIWTGCDIESQVASAYHIPSTYVDINFILTSEEKERRKNRIGMVTDKSVQYTGSKW